MTAALAWPAILGGIVMTWARALGEFGATIIFAGNFPGRTQTMPLAIYLGFERDLDPLSPWPSCCSAAFVYRIASSSTGVSGAAPNCLTVRYPRIEAPALCRRARYPGHVLAAFPMTHSSVTQIIDLAMLLCYDLTGLLNCQ